MAGTTQNLVTRRKFDYSTLASSTSTETTLLDSIDVSQWIELTLQTRVHLKTFQNSGAQMQLLLYAVSPTAEDPSKDFIVPTALATTTIALADAVPRLYLTAVPANAGAMLRLVLKPTMSGTVGTLSAELSVTLSCKA